MRIHQREMEEQMRPKRGKLQSYGLNGPKRKRRENGRWRSNGQRKSQKFPPPGGGGGGIGDEANPGVPQHHEWFRHGKRHAH